MNGVAVEELALSQLLYLIKAKFETLFRIAVKYGLFARHILAGSSSHPHLRSSRNQVAMFMHHGFHRFCIAVVPPCGIVSADASVRKVKLKPHHHALHASQDSDPTISVIEAQATVQITPHSSPTIAMPILQSPPPVIINVVAAQPVQTHLRKRHASLPPDVPVPGAEARACGRS